MHRISFSVFGEIIKPGTFISRNYLRTPENSKFQITLITKINQLLIFSVDCNFFQNKG